MHKNRRAQLCRYNLFMGRGHRLHAQEVKDAFVEVLGSSRGSSRPHNEAPHITTDEQDGRMIAYPEVYEAENVFSQSSDSWSRQDAAMNLYLKQWVLEHNDTDPQVVKEHPSVRVPRWEKLNTPRGSSYLVCDPYDDSSERVVCIDIDGTIHEYDISGEILGPKST